MVTLAVDRLTMEFSSGGYQVRPLNGLSFSVEDGQLVVLLGPSGCGKTTLLSCLAGLLTPTSGSIRMDGREVTGLRGSELSGYRRDSVGVVFQAFNLIPSLTARSNVMVPLRFAGVRRKVARQRATDLLAQVDLADRGHHRPDQLSGGQQQRVAIARALVHDPPLVLADEPTAHLDYVQVEGVLRLIREIASTGRLVVVATHDDRITQLADKVVELVPHRRDTDRAPMTVELAAGEVLFRQGDPSDVVYVVESGEIELYRELSDGGEEDLAVIREGGYFGELGPMMNLPRSASARALTPVTLTSYSVQLFRSLSPSGSLREQVAAG
jgi:putative ABC transport system ATP-binding protein